MSLVIGNKTQINPTPGNANPYTFSHNQNAGSDKFIMCAFTMRNLVNFSGCTYNSVPMSLLSSSNFGSLQQRFACYGLKTSHSGANNVVISFSGKQWSPMSIFVCSFTGCDGGGNVVNDVLNANPNPENINVSNGSVLYGTGISDNAFVTINIDGTNRTLQFQHNTNKQVSGALSANPLSSGLITSINTVNSGQVTNQLIEIKEKSTTISNSNFLQMF